MTGLQAKWPWKCGFILGYGRDCSVLPKQTGSGAQTVSYSVGYGGLSLTSIQCRS